MWHVFAECPRTRALVNKDYTNMSDIFVEDDVHAVILALTKELKIRMR